MEDRFGFDALVMPRRAGPRMPHRVPLRRNTDYRQSSGTVDMGPVIDDDDTDDDSGGDGVPPWQKEKEPSRADQAMQDLMDMIGERGGGFFDAQDFYDTESADLLQRSQGIDPLFGEISEDIRGVLRAQEDRELAGTSEFFERRGGQGGTGQLNALNRMRGQFGERRVGVESDLKLRGLQRSDDLRGEAYDLREQGLQALTSGIETGALPAELLILLENAKNSGKSGGGCNLLCFIITEEAVTENSLLSWDLFWAHAAYQLGRHTPETLAGYWIWATPVVRAMRRWGAVRRPVGWVVRRACGEAARRIGHPAGFRSRMGSLWLAAVPKVSRAVYALFQRSKRGKAVIDLVRANGW